MESGWKKEVDMLFFRMFGLRRTSLTCCTDTFSGSWLSVKPAPDSSSIDLDFCACLQSLFRGGK
jgi:hypothetical protein